MEGHERVVAFDSSKHNLDATQPLERLHRVEQAASVRVASHLRCFHAESLRPGSSLGILPLAAVSVRFEVGGSPKLSARAAYVNPNSEDNWEESYRPPPPIAFGVRAVSASENSLGHRPSLSASFRNCASVILADFDKRRIDVGWMSSHPSPVD